MYVVMGMLIYGLHFTHNVVFGRYYELYGNFMSCSICIWIQWVICGAGYLSRNVMTFLGQPVFYTSYNMIFSFTHNVIFFHNILGVLTCKVIFLLILPHILIITAHILAKLKMSKLYLLRNNNINACINKSVSLVTDLSKNVFDNSNKNIGKKLAKIFQYCANATADVILMTLENESILYKMKISCSEFKLKAKNINKNVLLNIILYI